jgi:hypothetical protein
MKNRQKKKEINGVQFSVAPFLAVQALRLKAYLAKLFGPALGQTLGALNAVPAGKSIGEI